jgi:hypothetical protein
MRLWLHRLRRLAASGSPVLFTGTVALVGLAFSRVAHEILLNPVILWVLLAVLAILLGLQMNAEYQRRTYEPTWMFKFDDDFNSDDTKRKRSKAAHDLKMNQTQLRDENFKSDALEDLLDFFEGIGYLMQGDEITPEVAHQAFYYWIEIYCSITREYIEKVQKKNPTAWECVKGLLQLTTEVEKERLKKLGRKWEPLDDTDIAKFLNEEIGLVELPSLPGSAPPGTWRITNADQEDADGRLATFAIVARPTRTSLRLLGSGFYLQKKGGFATAAHVALEAQHLLSENPDSVGISQTLPDGRTFFCPIWKFFIHPTADVAFGIPRAEFVSDRTGEAYRVKVLCLGLTPPAIGAAISVWSYPLHRIHGDERAGQVLQLQPNFYNGILQELFEERGPSVKLKPPYYMTSIHLHGGSSGGPVFNASGEVFGIASSSYDGAEDVAFVTPATALLDIEIPERISDEDEGSATLSLREIAARGQISTR